MFGFKNNSKLLTLPITDIMNINIGVVKYLLEQRSVHVNTLLDDTHLPIIEPTFLHVAIWNSDIELFQYLISKGANIHKSFENYGSALHLAVYKTTNNLRIINRLIDLGAPINRCEFIKQWTPLHIACYLGRYDIVMLLITRGADINATIRSENQIPLPAGNTPLHVAIEYKQVNIVELLCKWKVNLNYASVHRGTPLLFAVASGNSEIVKILIEFGAEVNCISTIQGNIFQNLISSVNGSYALTALHVAVLLQNELMVEILIHNGADVHVTLKNQFKTPLYCAVTLTNSKIVSLLFAAGAFNSVQVSDRMFIQNWIHRNHRSMI